MIEVLEGLPEPERDAYRARLVEHLSAGESAKLLGVPRSTYFDHLRRAVEIVQLARRRPARRPSASSPIAARARRQVQYRRRRDRDRCERWRHVQGDADHARRDSRPLRPRRVELPRAAPVGPAVLDRWTARLASRGRPLAASRTVVRLAAGTRVVLQCNTILVWPRRTLAQGASRPRALACSRRAAPVSKLARRTPIMLAPPRERERWPSADACVRTAGGCPTSGTGCDPRQREGAVPGNVAYRTGRTHAPRLGLISARRKASG